MNRTASSLLLLIVMSGYAWLWTSLRPAIFRNSEPDFACFYRAGNMVIGGDGPHVYDLATERQYDERLGTASTNHQGRRISLSFVFAPWTLIVFAPLAALSYAHAELLWFACNVACLLAFACVLRKRLRVSPWMVAVAMVAPLVFLPLVLALLQGQTSILLLLLFSLAYSDLVNGRDARAGCWIAMTTFKPQLALPLILALLVWRKWKTLAAFAGASVLGTLSVAIVGWHATVAYPKALADFSRLNPAGGGEHPESMPNLRGLVTASLQPAASPGRIRTVSVIASILLLVAMVLVINRRQVTASTFSLVMLITVLVSHHAYLHDATLLLLPLIFAVRMAVAAPARPSSIALSACAAAVFLVPLLPISLTTTAQALCCATAALAVCMALKVAGQPAGAEAQRPGMAWFGPTEVVP